MPKVGEKIPNKYMETRFWRNGKMKNTLLKDNGKDSQIQLKQCSVLINYAKGSEDGLDVHYALSNCANDLVFKTPVVDNLIKYKWSLVAPIAILLTIIQLVFNIILL